MVSVVCVCSAAEDSSTGGFGDACGRGSFAHLGESRRAATPVGMTALRSSVVGGAWLELSGCEIWTQPVGLSLVRHSLIFAESFGFAAISAAADVESSAALAVMPAASALAGSAMAFFNC